MQQYTYRSRISQVVRGLKVKAKPSQADLERTFIIIPAGEARNIGVREQNGRKTKGTTQSLSR